MASQNVATSDPSAALHVLVDQWIAPNERLLWTLVVCAFALDLATTAFGLTIGLVERNPIAASLLVEYGMPSLVGLKVVALATGLLCRSIVPGRYGAVVPFGMIVPSGAAVLINSLSIVVAL